MRERYNHRQTCAANRDESTGFTAFLSASSEAAAAFATLSCFSPAALPSFLLFLSDFSFLETFSTLGILSLPFAPMIMYLRVLWN
jgi:hypothetical protein